jgi:phosphatidylglycerol lysyltransferase
VAIVVGDPFGAVAHFSKTVDMFLNYCYTNDWQPAFVHTEPHFNKLYENHDFSLQLIGQEAVVDCHHFEKHVKNNKYFRNISNRFIKLNYAIEVLKPPHSDVVINRLKQISDEWLQLPSKGERGFVIGYFNKNYLNSCTILVLKDSTGKIQAFINKIPSFKAETASYDMIRYSNTCPGNCIDYLLINFIDYVYSSGFKKINLGLSPLAGVDSNDENNTLLNKSLSFIYSRGDRIYSFSGLNRFKSKFEPNWSNRYIAYTGGIRGFVRTVSALNKASKKINKN